ncbi:MAG: hypothetical protein KJ950_12390 [Proteobacteria bacterium]|nr:hypothetical protein [Pseudomonadota bacterium]MBU1687596.1 hypothetical protein [Pseudomonadota bacterium]
MEIQADLTLCLPITRWTGEYQKFLTDLFAAAGKIDLKIIALNRRGEPIPTKVNEVLPELIIYDHTTPASLPVLFNRAVTITSSRYYGLWTPGILPDSDCLETLISVMDETPELGICGPTIFDSTGNPLPSAGPLPFPISLLFSGRLPREVGHRPPKRISGDAMVIRAELLQEIGLLDEEFTCLYDLELCRRAGQTGWWIRRESLARASCPRPAGQLDLKPIPLGDRLRFLLAGFHGNPPLFRPSPSP